MQFQVKINDVKNTDELEGSWSLSDYKELLNRFDVPDAANLRQ
jgi:hypothetical protein